MANSGAFEEEWSYLIFSPEKEQVGKERRYWGEIKGEGGRTRWSDDWSGTGAWSLWTGRGWRWRSGGLFGGGSVSRSQYDYISMIVLIDLHLVLHLSKPAVWRCIVLFLPACRRDSFSTSPPLLLLYSWHEGIRLWEEKKKNTQPVATVVFLRSSSCSPWLRLSLYRLPSQGSNLQGLAGTWLKIRKPCMVAGVGARVSCWWTRTDTLTWTLTC